MSWSVAYTDDFGGWWAMLPEKTQDDLAAAIGLLKERGPGLAPPHAFETRESRHRRMRELRARSGGAPIRVLHAFDSRDSAILLIGTAENGGDGSFAGLLQWADALYDSHLGGADRSGIETMGERRDFDDLLSTISPQRCERIAWKKRALLSPGSASAAEPDPAADAENAQFPDNFDDLERWFEEHLSGGKVRLLRRAVRAAKKSPFKNPRLAYRALSILHDYYVPMRIEGGKARKDEYDKALRAANLTEAATFAGTRSGEYGDTYFVNHGGRKRELVRHLKGGNSRDPRYGFRLYFFWDDDDREVVVGSLPNHLTTRIS